MNFVSFQRIVGHQIKGIGDNQLWKQKPYLFVVQPEMNREREREKERERERERERESESEREIWRDCIAPKHTFILTLFPNTHISD